MDGSPATAAAAATHAFARYTPDSDDPIRPRKLSILASPDYVSSLITGGLLVIVTIVWAPDLSQWFRTTRVTGSVEAKRTAA